MFTLLSLLPLDKNQMLLCRIEKIKILNLFSALLCEVIFAIENFQNGELSFFDAQVGDTTCHIRSFYMVWLIYYSKNCPEKIFFLDKIKECHYKVQEKIKIFDTLMRENSSYLKELDSNVTLKEFLFQEGAGFILNKYVFFISLMFILSKYTIKDKDNYPSKINLNYFATSFRISKAAAKKYLRYYQKEISIMTCRVLIFFTRKNNFYKLKSPEIKALVRDGDNGLRYFPCFLGMSIIFEVNWFFMAPIRLLVKREVLNSDVLDSIELFFYPDASKKTYRMMETIETNIDFMVSIEGKCIYNDIESFETILEYKTRFNKYGIKQVFLFNMAAHPQFSGTILQNYRETPYLDFKDKNSKFDNLKNELYNAKNSAFIYGCCNKNETLFFLEHVRPMVYK